MNHFEFGYVKALMMVHLNNATINGIEFVKKRQDIIIFE